MALIIYKRRVRQALRNVGRILAALLTLRLPASELSLENPESLKIPFGVAVAFAVVLYGMQLVMTGS